MRFKSKYKKRSFGFRKGKFKKRKRKYGKTGGVLVARGGIRL